jgi:hypothetical protein
VSLHTSITRPFGAPEFFLSLRYRHRTRGQRCARVLFTVSTLLLARFGPFLGLYDSPIPWCYTSKYI